MLDCIKKLSIRPGRQRNIDFPLRPFWSPVANLPIQY